MSEENNREQDNASVPEPKSEPATEQSAAEQPITEQATTDQAAAGPVIEAPPPARRVETDEEKAARRKASLEAREAAKAAAAQAAAQAAQAGTEGRAAAKSASDLDGAGEAEAAPPREPSPNQPRLDRVTAILRQLVSEDAVEEAYINEPNDHLPTLVVKNEHWLKAAKLFRSHEELSCHYLRNVSGVDYETHMEVVYYPLNMETRECYCLKVRTSREQPSVPSVTPIWETANWNEREIYDLLGVDFPGHPDLRRIMMSDDWVGHPLRKDYVPFDPEV